jgi:hypothetical protein
MPLSSAKGFNVTLLQYMTLHIYTKNTHVTPVAVTHSPRRIAADATSITCKRQTQNAGYNLQAKTTS